MSFNLLLKSSIGIGLLLCLAILSAFNGQAQTTNYISEDFSSGKKPNDWVLDSAGTNVSAGTCQDGSRVFSFTCSAYPASSAGGRPSGFDQNVAVIDLDNVGGAASSADSLYCIVTDTVNTSGAQNLELRLDWEHESFGSDGTFRVEVWDNTSWQQVFSQGADGSGSENININSYSNPNLRVRFCFSTDGYAGSLIWGMGVDNIKVADVTCPEPTNLSTRSIGKDSVSLVWETGDSTQLSYLATVKGPNGKTVTSTDTNATITGLQSGTQYTANVKEVCSNNDTSLPSSSIIFSTKCNPFSADFKEGFDSVQDRNPFPADLFCWDTAGNENDQIEIVSGTANNDTDPPTSGPNKVTFNDADLSSGDTALLVSPQLSDISNYNNRIRLQAAFEDTADSRLFIGVMDSPDSTTSFTLIDTLTARSNQGDGAWQEFITDLTNNSLVGNADHFAIANGDGIDESSVDDIRYEAIPSCLRPVNLKVSNLAFDSVSVRWNSQNSNNQFLVNYDTGSFSKGKGANTKVVNDTTTNLQNLSDNANYSVYIAEICQSGDTSFYSKVLNFETPCRPFNAPYNEQFDGQTAVDPFGSERFCWLTRGNESDQIALVAYDNENDTDTPPTQPNKVTFNDADLANGDTALLISPKFSDLLAYDKRVRAQVAFEDSIDSRLFAGVIGDPADVSTFRVIDTFTNKSNQNETSFTEFTLKLNDTSLIDSQRYVAFANGDGLYETSIDDIVYETIPPCALPDQLSVTGLTDSSASIKWRGNGTGSNWVVEYDTIGFQPGNGNLIGGIPDTFTTITNLQPNTRYEAYVREICQSGDTSNYGKPLTFRTPCDTTAPVTLPYVEDFEMLNGSYTGYSQFCRINNANWVFQSEDTTGRLQFSGNGITASSGSNAATLDKVSGLNNRANDLILTINMNNYSTGEPYGLTFDHLAYQDTGNANDSVWVRGNDNDSWIGLYDLDSASGSSYQAVGPLNVSKPLKQNSQSFTSSFQLRFGQEGTNAVNDNNPDGRSFDNIRLTQMDMALSSFPEPSGLCGLSDQQSVSVSLRNTGLDTIPATTQMKLTYNLDTNTYPDQTINLNQPLAPGDSITRLLNTTFDLSAADTTYNIQASIKWDADQKPENDTGRLTLAVPPTNLRADNILDTSAQVKWNNTKSSIQTQVIWGFKGFNLSQSGSRTITTNANYTITGLQKATDYEVYIREICSNGDTGSLRGPISFTSRDAANDLEALDLPQPSGRCSFSANEPVTFRLVNFGFDTIPANTTLKIAYQKDNQALVKENLTLNNFLKPSDTVVKTFNQTIDLSQQGRNYRINGWVEWNDDQNGSNDTIKKSIYVSNVPPQPTVKGDTTCPGNPAILEATSSGKQFNWYSDTAGTLLLANSDTYSLQPSKDTTLYVRAYNNQDSCKSPYTPVKVITRRNPKVNFNSDTACARSRLQLQGQATFSGGNIKTYEWELGNGVSKNGRIIQPVYQSAGQYTVTFKANADNGCEATVQKSVGVRPSPKADFSSDTACFGNAVTLKEQSQTNGTNVSSYEWSLGNGQTSSGTTVNPSYSNAGSYDVKLKVDATNDCSDTAVKVLSLLPQPEADFSLKGKCKGEPTVFTNQSELNGQADLQYQWTFGDGETSQKSNPEHVYNFAGTLEPSLVAFYDSLNKTCADTAKQSLEIDLKIDATFSIDKKGQGTIKLTPDDNTADRYRWDFGNGDTSNLTSPEYTYAEKGTYTITLQTVSDGGCVTTNSKQITIETVGQPDRHHSNSVRLYPNPVKIGQPLTIDYSFPRPTNASLTLQTVTGQSLYRKSFNIPKAGSQEQQLKMPEKAKPGVYILQIRVGDKLYQKDILIAP